MAKYEWENYKKDIMDFIGQGKSTDQILDMLSEKYNVFPSNAQLRLIISKWREQQ